jgi:hypothetical protein
MTYGEWMIQKRGKCDSSVGYSCRPLAEEANRLAPAHSRLFKEVTSLSSFIHQLSGAELAFQMILVAKKSKPFEYTPKGTARRHVVIAKYDNEIEEAYKAIENAASLDNPPPQRWSREENLVFVRGIVRDVLKKTVRDGDDLFESGCDRCVALKE